MIVTIEPWSFTSKELEEKLKERCPQYEYEEKTDKLLIAKKSRAIGANLLLNYDRCTITGGFPSFLGQGLFVLFVVMLGIIIPLILYYFLFKLRMNSFEKEITEIVEQEFGVKKQEIPHPEG